MACHSVTPGEHTTGPSLAHVWNAKAATAQGFMRYSEALKRSGIIWNEATLGQWLADPARLVPGTSMTFPGVREEQARLDLIAYLKAVKEKAAPAPGEATTGMAPRKPDLKQAPPAHRVQSIRHCGDTYTVRREDGTVEKFWEFNLRFKTDTSRLGPRHGAPVIIGAGMRGDRASVVFASPKEISAAIEQDCD